MVTKVGKMLRIIRINTGDSLRTMANKLSLSASYLSAIENGKRNIPENFIERLSSVYELTENDKSNLQDAISQTSEKIKLDLTELSDKQKKLIYTLGSTQIDDDTLDKVYLLINKKEM